MGVKATIKDTGWKQLQETLKTLGSGDHVKVGVLDDGKGAEQHDPKSKFTTAQIAAVMEYGTSDGKIPARPWISATFDANRPQYLLMLRRLLVQVVDGRMTLERVLNIMGAQIASDIKARVTQGEPIPPPNAPSTIARKEALNRGKVRGKIVHREATGRFTSFAVTGVRTLIDTARMVGAVTWAFVRGPKT